MERGKSRYMLREEILGKGTGKMRRKYEVQSTSGVRGI